MLLPINSSYKEEVRRKSVGSRWSAVSGGAVSGHEMPVFVFRPIYMAPGTARLCVPEVSSVIKNMPVDR